MIARLLAIKIVLSILLLTGCATAPRTSPRFTVPDTSPIRKAIAVTARHQASVGDKIKKAQATAATLSSDCPGAKARIELLTGLLEDAYTDNKFAELSLQSAEGSRDQLQTELVQKIGQANDLAKQCDKCQVDKQAMAESRHTWVKRFWIAAGIVVLEGIWIFRKPLFALTSIGI